MNNQTSNIPWLKSRKQIILFIFIDFFFLTIFNSIFFKEIFLNTKIGYFEIIINYLLYYLAWTSVAYITGRYHLYQTKLLINNFYYYFFIIFSPSFLFVFIIDPFLNIFTSLQITEILKVSRIQLFLNLSILTFFIQLPFRILILNFLNSKKNKWFVLSDKILFNDLKKWSKNNLKKISFYLIDSENIKNVDFQKTEGLVINKLSSLKKSDLNLINQISEKGIEVIDSVNWCEINMQKLPSKLLINNKYLDNNLLSKHNGVELRIKRIGDISLAFLIIILSSPFVLLALILIKLEDNGPLFYQQERVGKGGKIFKITKLRTMKPNSEINGAEWSKKDDERVTRIGEILRKTRIDEIPQLLSIISGDMSLIGPRPERLFFVKILEKEVPFFSRRTLIRPGLSGWAQVNFPYGASIEDSEIKLSYDLFYIRHFSIFLDFLILFKTIKLVFNLKGSTPGEKI